MTNGQAPGWKKWVDPGLGFLALFILLVTFSRPPLAQDTVVHYLAVLVFFLIKIVIWFLLGGAAARISTQNRLSDQRMAPLFKGPFRASLAFAIPFLLAMAGLASGNEGGYMAAFALLLLGFCLAAATLASHWTSQYKAHPVLTLFLAGLGAPLGIMLSGWLTWTMFGESFFVYDPMMFL